jgi:choline monooxygenase
VHVVGHDLVVVRDSAGALRAWHNVCRHRGSKLVVENGRCKAFACPYHGWRYGLDGALIATPRFDSEGLALNTLGLIEAAHVQTWMGLVFVNFDKDAAAVTEWLGPLRHEAEAVVPANLVHETDLTAEVACNWKTYVDNYNEVYHVPILHPSLNRDLIIDEYRVENGDGVSMHRAKAREGVDQPGVFGLRFPNFAFITYFQGVAFLRMEPVGPRHTRLVYSHFRPATLSSEAFQPTIDYAWQVSKEDQWIAPLVQDNLERGVYRKGR